MKQNLLFFLLLIFTAFSYGQDDPVYPPAPAMPQQIIAAEYFIDNDPGVGNATVLSVTPGADITITAGNINTAGLANGFHYIGLRTRNAEGKWSTTALKAFIFDFDPGYNIAAPPQNITAAEYFIDNDPGHGNGHPITITPGVNIVDVASTIDVSGLLLGIHKLYIRTKSNEGRWSTTNIQDFTVDADPSYPIVTPPGNIIAAEYFIDNDPGHGNAHPVSFSQGVDISNIPFSSDIAGLADGVHKLYLRTRSHDGVWSITGIQDFTISGEPSYSAEPVAPGNIIAAEYFIDTDPGMGMGTAITVAPAVDFNNISFSVATDGLTKGAHTLHLRTRNQEGKWSLTNSSVFFSDNLEILSDTLYFGNIPLGISSERYLVIKNNSSVTQTINAINIGPGFSSNAALPLQINAGQSDSVNIKFTPVTETDYLDSIVLNTSAGNHTTILAGKGANPVFSWFISPAGGHDFGNVQLSNSSSFNFTIFNTSNVAVTLSNVVTGNSAFTAQFVPNTVIAAGGSLTMPVTFTPVTAGQYNVVIKILSSTQGVDSAVINAYGTGYAAGTPPELQFVNGAGYSGTSGVNPSVGSVGTFTYKILYKSVNNKAPMAGYPKVSIDLNGNQSFADADEGTFTMVKEGTSNDYVSGVVYSYTFTHSSNTSLAGYQFEALDEDGNAATSGISYFSGPVVSDDISDLRIFANDISFSDNNPQPGATFTMTALVSNSSNVPVANIPVKIYRDTILLGSTVLSSVPAKGSNSFNYTLNFAEEGFYPIKVWIDSSNTLGESNVLNNYAIRPVVVGSPSLPGGIDVTSNITRQECPALKVIISGNAKYFGTGTNDNVAGAEVTINTGTQTFKTTTNANGNYILIIDGVTCGAGNFAYAVTVTDFTFTSAPVSGSISMPCPAPDACALPIPPPPPPGSISITPSGGKCGTIAGGNGSLDLKIKVRDRNINNMWSIFDEVMPNAKLKVFIDGELLQERTLYQIFPSEEITIIQPWQIPENTNPVNISAELVYTYVEYDWVPNTADVRPHYITYTVPKNVTVKPEDNITDLGLINLGKKNNTAYQISDVNLSCITAGKHVVRVYDGGSILKTVTVNSLNGGMVFPVEFDISSLSPGTHTITIVTDDDNELLETNEANNEYSFTLTIPFPDLTVSYVTTSPSVPKSGTDLQFKAYIKNTGKTTGSFNVKFSVDGTQVGLLKTVNSVGEKDSVLVTSDPYVATVGANECGGVLEIIADVNNTIIESNESNNTWTSTVSADLAPYQTKTETGSQNNPARVRVNNTGHFTPAIRNLGITDAQNVSVQYLLSGVEIGAETIASVKAGEKYAAHGEFSYMFSTAGTYVIRVVADSADAICESDETNNAGYFYIEVTDSKPDLEVLSQYISPSSLNPNAGQNITIVGTVRNAGGKVTTPSYMRFFVDNIQLGDDVPFDAIEPGKDTTVAAIVTYSSKMEGTKTMKIMVDPFSTMEEERENNNEATRMLIVGAAPDMLAYGTNPIKFNPSGFRKYDSVTVSYSITNGGFVDGTAWVRFMILDLNGGLHAIDSLPFILSPGQNITLSKKMYFDIIKGRVVTQIVNCTPDEYNLLNNSDTLEFSTIRHTKHKITINGNLDMLQGLPDEVPGWIGGILVLNDFDLTVNGAVLNADADHYIVTNGTGRLILANNNTENIFPVGPDSLHTNFVKVANTGTPDIFSARVAPYVLLKGYSGDTVRTGNVNRTWFIDEETPGGSDVALTFHWKEGDEQPAFDRAQSIVSHCTTGWQFGNATAATALPENEFSTSQSGIDGFSPFTITNINSPLPLHLILFEASARDNNAVLKWTSENEINTRRFVVECSENGASFKDIGTIMALNQQGVNQYGFTHENLSGGTYYYRLRMEDMDGTYEYSQVKMVLITKDEAVLVYPNPARDYVIVSGLSGKHVIKLIGVNGRILRTIVSNSSTEKINLYGLAKGVYNLIVISSNGSVTPKKIVKE